MSIAAIIQRILVGVVVCTAVGCSSQAPAPPAGFDGSVGGPEVDVSQPKLVTPGQYNLGPAGGSESPVDPTQSPPAGDSEDSSR